MREPLHRTGYSFLRDSRILIVDDSEMNCEIIAGYLLKAGVRFIEKAFNGEEAIAKVNNYKPHIVLLDINMPIMDGYECLRRLRADPAHQQLPVIVQTGVENANERVRMFDVGATDLILKPVHFYELIARISVHLDRGQLIQNLQTYVDRNEEELMIARKMQWDLLPTQAVQTAAQCNYGIHLEHHFEPSSHLGGDFWGMCPIDKNRFAIYIVDFSGHGVTAALNTFRLHSILEQLTEERADPEKLLSKVNMLLCRLLPRGQFATMLYGILDTDKSSFTYASAAAPPFFVGSAKTRRIAQHETSGIPLGLLPSARHETRSIDFHVGSYMLLYSDALTEARGPDHSLLEEERAKEMMAASYRPDRGGGFIKEMMINFNNWSPARPLNDDLTLVWLQR